MKKLMIAASAAVLAAAVNAASVTWTSGEIYFNGEGSTLTDDAGTKLGSSGTAMVYLFTHLDADDYDIITEWDNATAYANFTADGNNSTLKIGDNTYVLSDTGFKALEVGSNGQAVFGAEEYNPHEDAYGLGIITYDKNGDGTVDYYSFANATAIDISQGGENNTGWAGYHDFDVDATWSAASQPTPTPEPTSGLLLLLGVAGLALRRKQK